MKWRRGELHESTDPAGHGPLGEDDLVRWGDISR